MEKKEEEETRSLSQKDKLQKEQRNSAVNLLKINDGWRSIRRQTQDAELCHDIIALQQTFKRKVDGLDSVIEKLVGDLQETERQEAHLHHIKALLHAQLQDLQDLQQQWECGLQDIRTSVNSQREQMLEQSQQQKVQLPELVLREEEERYMTDIRTMFDERLTMYTCSLEKQVAALEGREEVSDATQRTLGHLEESIVTATQLEEMLTGNEKEISEDLKPIKKLEDAVHGLREKVTSSEAENSSMEEDYTTATKELSCTSHVLKNHLTQSHKAARERLTKLTVQGDATIKKLQAVITKGERVLRAMDICRRLETKHATLLASSSRPTDECRQDTPAKDACGLPELQQLRRSISGAMVQREALRKRSKELRCENEQLRLLLCEHKQHANSLPLHVARAPTTTSTTPATRARSRVTVIKDVKK